ncbi:ATP-binding protein [Paenibacillus sp. JTLBN-2024]
MFERFYRAERSRSQHTGGSGLGLAIAKGIVDRHHGTISAQSDTYRRILSRGFRCAGSKGIGLNESFRFGARRSPAKVRPWLAAMICPVGCF